MSNAVSIPKIHRVLTGCVSAETAHVQADYPYGFHYRCQRRCWLEYKKGKGFRFVTQTNDPKYAEKYPEAPVKWNAPKSSTYTDFALLVLTDEHTDGTGAPTHVTWIGQGINGSTDQIEALMAAFWDQMDETQQQRAKIIHAASTAVGSKPTGRLFTVADAVSGEALSPEPVSAAWKEFAGLYTANEKGEYTSGTPLHYLGERTTAALFGLPRLGRLVRVTWVAGSGVTA